MTEQDDIKSRQVLIKQLRDNSGFQNAYNKVYVPHGGANLCIGTTASCSTSELRDALSKNGFAC